MPTHNHNFLRLKDLYNLTCKIPSSFYQSTVTPAVLPILERNLVPDYVIRFGIQRELEMELQKINKLTVEEKAEKNRSFVEELKTMPIAIQQDKGLSFVILQTVLKLPH